MNDVLEPTELLHGQLPTEDFNDRTLDEQREDYEGYLRGEALLRELLRELHAD